jgi:hypothetical protein
MRFGAESRTRPPSACRAVLPSAEEKGSGVELSQSRAEQAAAAYPEDFQFRGERDGAWSGCVGPVTNNHSVTGTCFGFVLVKSDDSSHQHHDGDHHEPLIQFQLPIRVGPRN